MKLFSEAGAGYIFPVAEHHNGFQMYRSELSDWNAVCMGPKWDIFMGHGKEFDSDVREPLLKGDF